MGLCRLLAIIHTSLFSTFHFCIGGLTAVHRNDLLIFSKDEDGYWAHVETDLSHWWQNERYIPLKIARRDKWNQLFQTESSITWKSSSSEKVRISIWKSSKLQVLSREVFLAIPQLSHQFIQSFSETVARLTEYTKYESRDRNWVNMFDNAFNMLKKVMTEALVHVAADWKDLLRGHISV